MTIMNSGDLLSLESCLPCTPEEERETIMELTREAEANLKEGDSAYVISARWWKDWQTYVGFDETELPHRCNHSNNVALKNPRRPGQLNNKELISDGSNEGSDRPMLHMDLQEGMDYHLVDQRVWKKLLEWYKGGPEIPRKVISEGINSRSLRVEVYPLVLKLIDARDNSQRSIIMSRKASVRELYDEVCRLLKLDQAQVSIWDYFNGEKHDLLENYDQTLEEAKIQMNQQILLERKANGALNSIGLDLTENVMALVPFEPSRLSTTTIAGGPALSNGISVGFGSSFLRDMEDGDDIISNGTKIDDRGLTGLQNLGNTCFMNSAIQCLVHTPPLVEYFLQDYTREINTKNPLGMQGELALSFGDLLRKLWSSGRTSVAPRAFKTKLARFAPQFSGYNQHDSQELLAFLLDGLHEDLNRVKNKPYIEVKDSDGRSDEEVAYESWKNHKARNDSIIVDVCQGQYKSTLVCPVCSKVSVTFDPFMYLSLPLPSTLTRSMNVTVFSGDGSALPMPFTVTVPKNGCCRDLVRALSIACCLESSEALLVAEVLDHRIRYLENPFEALSNIKDEEHYVAYRLPANHEKLVKLELVHVKAESFLSESQYILHRKLVGVPLVTCLAKDANTGSDIRASIAAVLTPLLRKKASPTACKDNGYGPSLDAYVSTDNTDNAPCSSGRNLSISNMEVDGSDQISHFQMSLTDDRCMRRTPINNDDNILPDSCIRVALEWSDCELNLYDFSFLEDLPEIFKSVFMSKKTRQEAFTLFSCLETFMKEEPLGPDDMWYCPRCKQHRQATKKLDLWRLPEILVVHLKRFSYSRFLKNKLDTFVSFPVRNLDLSKYVLNKAATPQSHVYELYAVSNHYGGLGGGHYTAYAKLIEEGTWYHFDDGHVSAVSEDAIKTSAAYVLFYRRTKVNSADIAVE
ncbi:ubiquitin carboxyl-terminal hydrolase 9-like [Phalaenopsis equestris]|uniref:ubiquitin carboxyl-terminal hydrolase 9-like n=1 Tax=Phalaenopsis equestris TaxID=78828 RepID=UPI0009E2C2D8|nr:ubiquitin carboxyl-terminal hydrolase 9-like [Phalaenopsis equestris]